MLNWELLKSNTFSFSIVTHNVAIYMSYKEALKFAKYVPNRKIFISIAKSYGSREKSITYRFDINDNLSYVGYTTISSELTYGVDALKFEDVFCNNCLVELI